MAGDGDVEEQDRVEAILGGARSQFLAFVRKRVDDPDLAEDILQDALLRAVQGAGDLRDDERLVAWFYAILRNAITDAYRRRDVRRRRVVSLDEQIDEPTAEPDDPEDAVRVLCECFRTLLPALKPEYSAVIEAVDLREEPPSTVAERLGITQNNLNVRRHRARAALRDRLEETCRTCSVHGCLDCTCDAAPAPV